MNRTRIISILLSIISLHLFLGCSDIDNNDDDGGISGEQPAEVQVIYEANLKLFGQSGCFRNLEDRLGEIKALGTDILWLMPIYEEGVKKGIGSPYCVKDYLKTNPKFGTLDELKSLVDKAHSMEMKVIFDWVANHTSWDNVWTENKEWYELDGGGNFTSPNGWNDVIALDFSNEDMQEAMIAAMEYWITETGTDGYRCDHVEGVPHDFWEKAVASLKKIKGDGLTMLAESGSSSYYADGFDMAYAWSYSEELPGVIKGASSLTRLYELYKEDMTGIGDSRRMRYATSHDMSSNNSLTSNYKSKEGAMAAFVIASMMTDTPMIYSSQEVGYPDRVDFFRHMDFDWTLNPEYLQAFKDYMAFIRRHQHSDAEVLNYTRQARPPRYGMMPVTGKGCLPSSTRRIPNCPQNFRWSAPGTA